MTLPPAPMSLNSTASETDFVRQGVQHAGTLNPPENADADVPKVPENADADPAPSPINADADPAPSPINADADVPKVPENADAPATDFKALFAEARALSAAALDMAAEEAASQLRHTGERIRQEQDRLFDIMVGSAREAVLDSASKGGRSADVLNFDGADKFGEFTYLYMIKGPVRRDQLKDMKAMGVRPLLPRLNHALRPFFVSHVWDRMTNENAVRISW